MMGYFLRSSVKISVLLESVLGIGIFCLNLGRGDKDQAALTVEVLQQIWYFANENKILDISGPVVRKTLKSMEIVF